MTISRSILILQIACAAIITPLAVGYFSASSQAEPRAVEITAAVTAVSPPTPVRVVRTAPPTVANTQLEPPCGKKVRVILQGIAPAPKAGCMVASQ